MDIIKHLDVFDPARLQKANIAIAGVGASGSALAINIAKLGIDNITLFDHDIIERHNLPNQLLYGPDDVGFSKSKTAANIIERLTGYLPTWYTELLNEKNQLRYHRTKTLFICVDSMKARKEIYDACIKTNIHLELIIDGRMGARGASVYVFANNFSGREYYEKTLYNDDEGDIEKAACGTVLSIGATAMMLASQMTWAFINACNPKEGSCRELITNYQNPAIEYKDETKVFYSR